MITVTVDNAAALAELQRLNRGSFQSKLRRAVRETIKAGKSEARARIIARYTAKSPLSLGKVSTRIGGLRGSLTYGGRRNPLKKFNIRPRRRINPPPAGGVFAQIVKGQGGSLSHAFLMKSGGVFQRVGRSRFPIKSIKTISLGGMAKAVAAQVVKKMDSELERSLQEL